MGVLPDGATSLVVAFVILLVGYKSFKAIESPKKEDDTKWLTFWFVFSIVLFAKEVAFFGFAYVVPFYNEGTIALVAWAAFFNGAEKIYQVIRPVLLKNEKEIDKLYEKAQLAANAKLADAEKQLLKAAEAAKVAAEDRYQQVLKQIQP